ncbi:MAG: class I SAM-dependent methyltransferase [Dysgonamonadaceae bacterium]|jgi:hypothetical protein
MSAFFQRKRTAKGFGVHSPFAFYFITKVINEKLPYNAYFDIENHLSNRNINPKEICETHYLSFRLVNYFHPKNILEIGSEKGINTLFLTASSKKTTCVGVESDPDKIAVAQKLLSHKKDQITIRNTIPSGTFDAIFFNLNYELPKNTNVTEILIEHSNDRTFWMMTNIDRNKATKSIWKKIKDDERARLTFDKKHLGIVILNSNYYKLNYLI